MSAALFCGKIAGRGQLFVPRAGATGRLKTNLRIARLVLSLASLVLSRPLFGAITAWPILDASLFFLVAWRISKRSRTWAILGLGLYLVESVNAAKVLHVASFLASIPLRVVSIGAFVRSVRGTFKWRSLTRDPNFDPLALEAQIQEINRKLIDTPLAKWEQERAERRAKMTWWQRLWAD